MITKIILITYLSLSLALIIYTYIQYKITFSNDFENNDIGYDLTQSKVLDILSNFGLNVNRFKKVINILKNYYIEISIILSLSSFIMLLYLAANLFNNINIITRILTILLTASLTLYSVYLYFLIKEYNNILSGIISNSAVLQLKADKIEIYKTSQKNIEKINKYSIVYIAISCLILLNTIGSTIFGF
jgi:hypothetical protein